MKWPEIALILIATCAALTRAEGQNGVESNIEAERARIAAARQVADQRMALDEAACHRKFAVNDCLSVARSQRRETLADLRRQEVALNDGQRRQAAAMRQERMDNKAFAASTPRGSVDSARTDRAQPTRSGDKSRIEERAGKERPDSKRAVPLETETAEVSRASLSAQRAADAAKRAEQVRAKTLEAREHQARAERRSRDQGKSASPLPSPP